METPGGEDNIRTDSRRFFCICKVYYPAILSVDLQQPFCSIILQVQIYSHQINYSSEPVYISSYLLASVDKVGSSLIWFPARGRAQDLGHTFHTHKQELHTLLAVLDLCLGWGIAFLNVDSEAVCSGLLSGDWYLTLHTQQITQQLRIENREEKHQLIQEEEFAKIT